MANVLVTGGSGFLGSFIVEALAAKNHGVRSFDLKKSLGLCKGAEEVVGDICNPEEVEKAVKGCDCIYHLAAFSDLNAGRTQPSDVMNLNIMGLVNVLEAARKAGIARVIYASTVYVYSGEGGFYRVSKQAGESIVEEYGRQFGMRYTILRYGSLYGPRSDERNGVYRLLKQAFTAARIRHIGTPDDTREYIHVEDAARLSVEVMAEEYDNQHLIITGNYPMRIRDLFTMFSEILGKKIEVEYILSDEREGHYRVTPYQFNPRLGKKMTANISVDIGPGLLQIVEQLFNENHKSV
jgi:UDP-glucose 4-epimerase